MIAPYCTNAWYFAHANFDSVSCHKYPGTGGKTNRTPVSKGLNYGFAVNFPLQQSVVTQSSLCSARGGFSSVLDAGNLYPSNEGACVLVNSCDPAVTGSS